MVRSLVRYGRTAITVVAAAALVFAITTGATGTAEANNCKPSKKWRGTKYATTYRIECQVASLFSPAEYAAEYRLGTRNPVEVCLRYAEKTKRPAWRQATFEGCVQGFRIGGYL